ncbi:hypothetical protein LguiB_012622 [Lonicera macranthoides]
MVVAGGGVDGGRQRSDGGRRWVAGGGEVSFSPSIDPHSCTPFHSTSHAATSPSPPQLPIRGLLIRVGSGLQDTFAGRVWTVSNFLVDSHRKTKSTIDRPTDQPKALECAKKEDDHLQQPWNDCPVWDLVIQIPPLEGCLIASLEPEFECIHILEVLVEQNSSVRTIILNRPKQLNALSSQMISRLLELFLAYEEDHNVKLIILKGKGRAFCAGGDVAAVVCDIKKGGNSFLAFHMCNWKLGAKYFWKEFILNYVMATYHKPQVSILYGIVMGGGAGASIHGRFRVATENSLDLARVFDNP